MTFSLVGLALAVILWGLQYKLSLYHPHANHFARVGVAKLWLGPRKVTLFAKNSGVKFPVPAAPQLSLPDAWFFGVPDCSKGAYIRKADFFPKAATIQGQTTPRSPPIIRIDRLM